MKKAFLMGVPLSVLAVLAAGAPALGMITADATIAAHRARQDELVTAQQEILALADSEKRELTAEEKKQLDELSGEFDRLAGEIERRERFANQHARITAPQPRVTAAEPLPGDDVEEPDVAPARLSQVRNVATRTAVPALSASRQIIRPGGNGGFRSFGEFANVVRIGSSRGGHIDDRLLNLIRNAAATQISQEGIGADGGYAVPPDFLTEITQTVLAEDSLLALCDPLTSTRNSISVPMDETTQWGTGGIKAYWEGEANAIGQSKPALNNATVRLNKLAALVPITEELLEDAPALDSYLRRKAPEAIDWSASMGLVWGTGAGMPLGIMNSPALITQAAEGGQTADTINANNVVKMHSRLPTRSQKSAVWLIHPDAMPQLPLMTIGNQPIYLPPGGLAGNPLGILLGRPVIPHQVCSTVGDLGDLMLFDFKQYLAAIKSGGVKLVISIHLWFDQDLQAFKFTIRIAGQPWWSKAQTPRSGTNTISPFVTLAAR